MRVLFCKIHCPSFICFCKPSSHIYTTGPLKLENTPHVPNSNLTTTTTTTTNSSVVSVIDEAIDNKKKAEEESVVNGKILQNQNQKQEKLEEEEEEEQQEEEEEQQEEEEIGENSVKSSIKKPVLDSKEVEKKRVQWMDFMGKELVEVREFEASEIEDIDNDSEYHRGCVCTIL